MKLTILIVCLVLVGALIAFPKELSPSEEDPSIRRASLEEKLFDLEDYLDSLPKPHVYGTPYVAPLSERQRLNATYIREHLGDIFVSIARCESGLRQFNDDGTPLVSRTSDVGVMQINQVHWERAKTLGIDIYTLEGNVAYASILASSGGTRDWYMSRHCWDK